MTGEVEWEALWATLSASPDFDQRLAQARQERQAYQDAYFRRLGELRRAREMTQAALAARLGVAAPSVSKVERQADLYVSTLRRYVEAMGGQLVIRAVFPDQDVEIDFDDFERIDHDNPELDPPGEAAL